MLAGDARHGPGGLVPACASTSVDLAPTLKSCRRRRASASSRGCASRWSSRRWRCRSCCSSGAGLFVRSLTNLLKVDPGFAQRSRRWRSASTSRAAATTAARSGSSPSAARCDAAAHAGREVGRLRVLRRARGRRLGHGLHRRRLRSRKPGEDVGSLCNARQPRATSRRSACRWSPAATSTERDAPHAAAPTRRAGRTAPPSSTRRS